ncbi:endonuclease/exonuclease/phosphatase family protein [Cellulomonas alba]|uniref:Endonuclease/exonuclease/phosphatase family protein n=1 Tax=Cellulomonas alba TaxID=3053467 RepID=A0ABT7SER5_9CELL|nr:endonuclease/exonuclease/phosphatase family protein [Cellulomonas alba]MDM7854680.1 endonuclease/exonuclease/phosphatase family protein [Cellulomonas alba]
MRHRHRHRLRRLAPVTPLVVIGLAVASFTASQAFAQEPRIEPVGPVAVSSVGWRSFHVDWARPEGAASTRIAVATDPLMRHVVWSERSAAARPHAYVDRGLTEGTEYFLQVTPSNGKRVGDPTPVRELRTGWRLPGYLDAVHVGQVGTGGFSLSWARPTDASSYRVVASAHPDLSQPFLDDVVWETSTRVAAPRDGARYYVSVLPLRGSHESAPTTASVTLPVKHVAAVRAPVAQPRSDGTFDVRWPQVANATGYTVSLASSQHGRAVWTSKPTAAASMRTPAGVARSLRGIVWVRVTASRFGRVPRTSGSVATARVQGAVTGRPRLTIKVASYNLLGPQYRAHGGESWRTRFAAEGRALRGFDVAGVQEAPRTFHGGSPQQVVARHARLTIARHPSSHRDCAAGSTPILYRASRFQLTACGSTRVSDTRRDQPRYVTWAVLRDKATHRSVLVADTHLTAHLEGAGSRAAAAERLRQARRVAAVIRRHNPHHLPVVLVGDLNSYLGSAPATPVGVFAQAGLADGELTADRLVGTRWNSYHGFHATKARGHHLDHVLTSSGTRVVSLEVRRTNERHAPSDHHRVSAVIAIG